jgi:8-oxo-dGTP diphosphatase
MNQDELRDRRRTHVDPARVPHFVLLHSDFEPPFERVTSVAVVPFTKDGNIVATLQQRGIDLPGGHVRCEDMDIYATARREAMEEARISLGDLRVACVIQSDYFGQHDLTYMVVVTGLVQQLHDSLHHR